MVIAAAELQLHAAPFCDAQDEGLPRRLLLGARAVPRGAWLQARRVHGKGHDSHPVARPRSVRELRFSKSCACHFFYFTRKQADVDRHKIFALAF